MNIDELTDLGPKLRNSEVTLFEKTIGAKLPEDYRKFLLLTNGAEPIEKQGWFKMKTKTNRKWSRIRFFYSLRRTNLETWLLGYMWKMLRDRVSPGWIPIATDVYGNQILIGLQGKIHGHVSFWSHEYDEPAIKLASSFNEFLEQITTEPP